MLTNNENESARKQRAATAHQALARLIKDELRVRVDPRELQHFIRNNWARIADYAHLIHGEK